MLKEAKLTIITQSGGKLSSSKQIGEQTLNRLN